MMDDGEKFWVGSKRAWVQSDYVVNRMQASDGKLWLEDTTGLRLDPNYSDYSVRVYHPNSRTLSFILATVAIIPKSLAQRVFNLLGEYLYGSAPAQDCDMCIHSCVDYAPSDKTFCPNFEEGE